MSRGTLFLIPSNLSEPVDAGAILPATALETARRLRHFVAENAKSARAFLKAVGTPHPIAELDIHEWPRQADAAAMQALLGPALAGEDLGLLSEAGAPAVADPGALLVAAAHQAGIVVRPLVGPSSILLGLMACGFNGQKFAFHGYLPQDKAARIARIRELEQESRRRGMTQVFIETPYRNAAMVADLLATLAPATRLCIAHDLTGRDEAIVSATIAQLRSAAPQVPKVPAIFLLLAA